MSSTDFDIPLSLLLEEQRLVCIGLHDWLNRARAGEIKRPPEEIERKADKLRKAIAIGKLLKGLQNELGSWQVDTWAEPIKAKQAESE